MLFKSFLHDQRGVSSIEMAVTVMIGLSVVSVAKPIVADQTQAAMQVLGCNISNYMDGTSNTCGSGGGLSSPNVANNTSSTNNNTSTANNNASTTSNNTSTTNNNTSTTSNNPPPPTNTASNNTTPNWADNLPPGCYAVQGGMRCDTSGTTNGISWYISNFYPNGAKYP